MCGQLLLDNLLSIVCDYTPLFYSCNQSLFLAVFHDAIRGIFPDIVMLLKDNNENVQLGGICAIGKLAEHSMYCMPLI